MTMVSNTSSVSSSSFMFRNDLTTTARYAGIYKDRSRLSKNTSFAKMASSRLTGGLLDFRRGLAILCQCIGPVRPRLPFQLVRCWPCYRLGWAAAAARRLSLRAASHGLVAWSAAERQPWAAPGLRCNALRDGVRRCRMALEPSRRALRRCRPVPDLRKARAFCCSCKRRRRGG